MRTLLVAIVVASCAACEAESWRERPSLGDPSAVASEHGHHGGHDDDHGGHDDDHGGHDDDDHGHHDEHDHHHAHVVLTPELRRAASRVLILQSTRTDRLTEVVGVVDVHADSGDQDEALDELRAQALTIGADAVLGVEFHHGETHGQPTHLSGLAVRFLTRLAPSDDR